MNPANLVGRDVVGTSIALFEETIFRGLVLAILLNRFHSTRGEVTGCVVLSSVLFGFAHLPTNPYWEMNVAQWIYATFAGVGLAAVLLRTRSIWLVVCVHALMIAASIATNALLGGDAVLLGETGTIENARRTAVLAILPTVPVLLYGLYLLRDPGKFNIAGARLDADAPQQ